MMGLPDLFQLLKYLLSFSVGSLAFIWGLYIAFGWITSVIPK